MKGRKRIRLEHGMLLKGKGVMDDALPLTEKLKELVPKALHEELEIWIEDFECELAQCDVSERYHEHT